MVYHLARRRAPRGARGLKCSVHRITFFVLASRPSRGAWIEITSARRAKRRRTSRPSRGAWIEISRKPTTRKEELPSRPSRGAWIEIYAVYVLPSKVQRRAPRGARGLKFEVCGVAMRNDGRSRPSRGAWIEMCNTPTKLKFPLGRAPRGARGLKFIDEIGVLHSNRRAPRGARGLKSLTIPLRDSSISRSRPSRGAWIEINSSFTFVHQLSSRAPRGARGLKLQST